MDEKAEIHFQTRRCVANNEVVRKLMGSNQFPHTL